MIMIFTKIWKTEVRGNDLGRGIKYTACPSGRVQCASESSKLEKAEGDEEIWELSVYGDAISLETSSICKLRRDSTGQISGVHQ